MKVKHANDPACFVKRYTVTKDGELAKKDVYSLDEEAIAKEAQYDTKPPWTV